MFSGFGGSFGAGVKKYTTMADLPLTGVSDGTLAHVETNLQGEGALYLRTDNGWYKIATVNLAPSIVEGPDADYELPNDGSPLVLSLVAADPEGLPVSWTYQVSAGAIAGVADVSQDGGTFTLTADPAAVSGQTPGEFSLTFVASDGVSLSSAVSAFTLSFATPSRLLLSFAAAEPKLLTYDLLNSAAYDSYSGLFTGVGIGATWVSDTLAIVGTNDSGENPVFLEEADGIVSVSQASYSLPNSATPGSPTGVTAASPDGTWCGVVTRTAPFVAFYEIVAGVPTYRPYSGDAPADDGETIAFHPDGRFAVVADNLSGIIVYDLQSGTPVGVRTLPGLSGDGANLVFSASGDHLYIHDLGVKVFDFDATVGTLSNLRAVPNAPGNPIYGLTLSPDGSLLGIGANPAVVLDVSAGPDSATVASLGVTFPADASRSVTFSPDGSWVALPTFSAPYLYLYSLSDGILTPQAIPTNPVAWPLVTVFTPGG